MSLVRSLYQSSRTAIVLYIHRMLVQLAYEVFSSSQERSVDSMKATLWERIFKVQLVEIYLLGLTVRGLACVNIFLSFDFDYFTL